ncbi:MAG TPA: hypothetical protein VGP07_09060 [Polyangia bacterium]|jgi:hypothetical protein
MHLRHIDPRSIDWKDAMLDEVTKEEGGGSEPEPEIEMAAMEGRHSPSPPTLRGPAHGFSAPSR